MRLSLRADARLDSASQLVAGGYSMAVQSPELRAVLTDLQAGGRTEEELRQHVHDAAHFYFLLDRLERAALLRRTLMTESGPFATLEKTAPGPPLHVAAPPDGPLTLSRFACVRRVDDHLILETPLEAARLVLHDARACGLLGHLAAAPLPFVSLLQAAGALAGDDGAVPVTWEFHDLLFHARSRLGRHDGPFGGTFAFKGVLEPLPAVKPPMSSAVIDLPHDDAADSPLSAVMASRRSIRTYGDTPISLEDLGNFLYRCARVTRVDTSEWGEVSRRPYPGGGACYELEIYVGVERCQGLEPGLYHYRPLEHQLSRLSASAPDRMALTGAAQKATGVAQDPQVVIFLTARFGRLAWKYRGMAYATSLKNVGVLYQTMYLVATSLGLAPCALGAGDSDRFAQATGIDYYEESTVGEFLLGSRC